MTRRTILWYVVLPLVVAVGLVVTYAPNGFAASLNSQHGLLKVSDLNGTSSGGIYGLPNGFATATQFDVTNSNSCHYATSIANGRNVSMNTLRQDYMNQSFMYRGVQYPPASYVPQTWLSALSAPNVTNPVYVDYGQKSIKLQINSFLMLCGDLVKPNYTGNSCNSKVSVMYNDNRWVKSSNPDTAPNPLGSDCLEPALSEQNTRITGLTTTTTGSLQGTTNLRTPQDMTIVRDNNSRYWYVKPVTFIYTFNSPAGITQSGTLHMTVNSKEINEYTGVDRCSIAGGDSITVSNDTDFRSQCYTYADDLSLNLRLRSNYGLTPDIQVSASSVTAGGNYSVSGDVSNSGSTGSTGTKWQITKMVYAPGVTPPNFGGGRKATNPCATFRGYQAGSCQSYQSGTKNFAIGQSGALGSSTDTANVPVGSSICYLMSVNTPTPAASPAWGHSALSCVVVGKKPAIQIWGGDLRAGDDVSTSQTVVSSPAPSCYYGSWVEYGALIDGTNTGARFGSGAALAGTPSACTHALGGAGTNPMTFANADSGGVLRGASGFGNYGDTALTQPASIYATMANNQLNIPAGVGAFNSNLASLRGYYKLNGDVTINTSSIPAGRTIVIDDPGHTVTIAGNISYPANVGSVAALPQVVIVAKTIKVNDTVTNVDAWLLADTLIDTCGNKTTTQVSLTVCNKPLQLNGPFVSNNANFKRTAGSDEANPGTSAETIDLRADAYLWEYAQASQHVTPTIVQVTQLPPRY